MVPMATSWPAYSSVPVSVSLTISSFGWAYFLGKPQISRPATIGGSSSRYIWATKVDVLAAKPAREHHAGFGVAAEPGAVGHLDPLVVDARPLDRLEWIRELRRDHVGIGLVGNDHEFAIDEAVRAGRIARAGRRHRGQLEDVFRTHGGDFLLARRRPMHVTLGCGCERASTIM